MRRAADLVVVGAGTAGIPAAIEAADRGAHVVLVDKQPRVGGMLHVSTGQFSGAGTRRQRERGIEDHAAWHLEDVESLSHGGANHALVRTTVLRQGQTVDWLDDLGFDFHPEAPRLIYGHELYRVPRTFQGRHDGRSLLWLLQRELDKRLASGRIELLLSSRVGSLLTDGPNAVTGVEVHAPDGTSSIRAGAVVLATGGYAANRDLVQRLLPTAYRAALTGCLEHATGDGLLMAQTLGAATTSSGTYLPTMSLIPDPDRPGFTLGYNAVRISLVPAYRQPHEIWINRRGERWVAEDTPSPQQREQLLLMQPGLQMGIVWDEQAMETADPILVPAEQGWTRERIAREARRGHFIWTATTLSELADRLDVDAVALERSVARYNQAVDVHHDAEFGRSFLPSRVERPPFYGLWSQAAMLMSREGLKVTTDLQVVDEHGRPIRGLYAVGEILGASQFMGDSFVGGMSVGPCLTLGRLVGQRLAAVVAPAEALT
jgi:fumarate reductase flavoprotein subunit